MAVSVSSLPESLSVAPGGEAVCPVTIRNDSEIVDEYAVEVLGDAAAWSTVEPRRVSLMPGTSAEVAIAFRPPRETALPPGPLPVGVRAVSLERPADSAVREGTIEILAFGAYAMELVPRTSHGSRGGKHEVAFDNAGNRPVQVRLGASDPDRLLRFRFAPPALDAAPGSASFAKLQVRFAKRYLRGPARTREFVVTAEPEGEEPLTAQGTAVQQALVPNWLLGVLGAIAALALLWFLLFKPQVQDTAKNAAKNQVVQSLGPSAATNASSTTPAGGGAGGGSTGSAGGGSGSGSGGGGAGTGTGGSGSGGGSGGASGGSGSSPDGVTKSFSKRLFVACSSSCSAAYKTPSNTTFVVNDVVLGNPRNAKGTLTVSNGSTVLFVENLDNFRDLDFHFDPGITIPSGQKLSIAVRCLGSPCSAAGFFSGSQG